jgi:uncharacterized protein
MNKLEAAMKAAEYGDAQAQYNLGLLYQYGFESFWKKNRVPWNREQALVWYRKAAAQGHADALFKLGAMCPRMRGSRTSMDGASIICTWSPASEEAYAWFLKAAEQGHAEAQLLIGEKYEFCIGLPEDTISPAGRVAFVMEAVAWYRKAAEQGNACAQLKLGYFYDDGTGLPKDHKEAAFWYRKAAEQGNACAQYSRASEPRAKRGLVTQGSEAGSCRIAIHVGHAFKTRFWRRV